MAVYEARFPQLAGRAIPLMTVAANSLDGFSTQLEKRVGPLAGNRPVTITARRDHTLTVTSATGARLGTGTWRLRA